LLDMAAPRDNMEEEMMNIIANAGELTEVNT
jgi:hypothetical protein